MIRAITQLLFHTPNSPKPPTIPSTPSLPSSKVPSPPVLTDLSYDSDHPVKKPRTETNTDWKKRKPPPSFNPPQRQQNTPHPKSPPPDYDPNDNVYYTRSGRRSSRNYYPPWKASAQRRCVYPETPRNPTTRLSPSVTSTSSRPYSGPRASLSKSHTPLNTKQKKRAKTTK